MGIVDRAAASPHRGHRPNLRLRSAWRGVGALLLASIGVMGHAACSDVTPTGPSLADIRLTGISLAASAGDASVCCCRVVGTAVNGNAVAVHATLRFSAYARPQDSDPLATTIYFIKDFQPGAVHAIDAPGLLVPCRAIGHLKTEVEVRGLTYPPL